MPKIIFVLPDKTRREVEAPVGKTLLEVAHDNEIHEIEGACGGALACSTCHVILPNEWFSKMSAATDDEEDMLDLAHGLQETSRLGCQIVVREDMDGMEVTVPEGRQDFVCENV